MRQAATSPDELRLWHLLLGAMLADRSTRDLASRKLAVEDAPKELQEAWRCITSGNRDGVRQIVTGWGLEVLEDGVLASVVRRLAIQAVTRFAVEAPHRLSVRQGLEPQDVLDWLHKVASQLEAKLDKLDKRPEKLNPSGES